MRKFKHKKEGLLATQDNPPNTYQVSGKSCLFNMPKELIEDTNDWEEIVEPSYLITAFKNTKGDILEIGADGSYYFKGEEWIPGLWKETLLKQKCYSVFSIKDKRGVEFSINDWITDGSSKFQIKSFELADYILGGCYACGYEQKLAIQIGKKCNPPEPILITEDGKEMFEGDDYNLFSVFAGGSWEEQRTRISSAINRKDNWKFFHTKEAREEYVKLHKPLYSLAEIKSVCEECGHYMANPRGYKLISLDDLKALNK